MTPTTVKDNLRLMEKVGSIVRRVIRPGVLSRAAAEGPEPPREVSNPPGRSDLPSLPCKDADSYDHFVEAAYRKYRKAARRRICTVSPDGVFEERLNPWS